MIPQPYPLWFATRTDRADRVVAWTEVDGHEGLFPVVFWQGAAAAGPVIDAGWLGDTAEDARAAAEQAAHAPQMRPALPNIPEPSVGSAVMRATMDALERDRRPD